MPRGKHVFSFWTCKNGMRLCMSWAISLFCVPNIVDLFLLYTKNCLFALLWEGEISYTIQLYFSIYIFVPHYSQTYMFVQMFSQSILMYLLPSFWTSFYEGHGGFQWWMCLFKVEGKRTFLYFLICKFVSINLFCNFVHCFSKLVGSSSNGMAWHGMVCLRYTVLSLVWTYTQI